MNRRFPFLLLFLPMVLSIPRSLPAQSQDKPPSLDVAPDLIRISTFYRGADVHIRAELPDGCDGAVLKIQGEDEEIQLNRKGRVSIFWLNVDEVTVSGAPGIYMINSSGPLNGICTRKDQNAWTLGYEALERRIRFQSGKALSGSEFPEFISLKENNGSYQRTTEARLTQNGDRQPALEADFYIPPVMPSGSYPIKLYCFKDLVLMAQSSAEIRVEKIGLPNYLYGLAHTHPAYYGLLAIVIAMATGIIMGLVFGSRSRRKQ
jgi:uncharacterized protein (TIGR02186 family)